MLTFDYHEATRSALITWEPVDENADWLSSLQNALRYAQQSTTMEFGANSISLPWWAFLSVGKEIDIVIRGYKLKQNCDYQLTPKATDLLLTATKSREYYRRALDSENVSPEELQKRLIEKGFDRQLTREQVRNICVLAGLPAGATFSVPGAGKTTEALAIYAYRSQLDDKLLIIAPKNAFAAWDEQFSICFPNDKLNFIRLRKTSVIPRILTQNPKMLIIGYHQLVQVMESMYEFVSRNSVHIFLDESHRIKGAGNVTTEAVLGFSHLATSKLIMSGTPMPQATSDLVPQLRFLFPEISVAPENAVEIMKPIYVRTTKSELKLPEVSYISRRFTMDPIQRRVYELIKSEIVRESSSLRTKNRQAFRILGRSIVRAIQISSNPALLAKEISFAHSEALSAALREGSGPKMRYLMKRVRELVSKEKKVLVWTTFVENVETIAFALQDIGSVYIHGGVDTGSEEDSESREGKIKSFHDDPDIRVLVANPAAASEGISLHTVCHNAIYLDRSFNVAQYLQSVDRIHRLGMAENASPEVEILECENTVDVAIQNRLQYKISQMSRALDDPSLTVSSIYAESDIDGEACEIGGIDEQDAEEVFRILGIG